MIRVPRTTILLLVLVGACRGATDGSTTGNAQESGKPAPAESAPVAVSGSERIGWTQAASDVSHYRFVLYVDGGAEPKELPDAHCTQSGPGKFDCDARLPKLAPGQHQVQVEAVTTVGNKLVEGSKSDPFMVVVTDAGRSDHPR